MGTSIVEQNLRSVSSECCELKVYNHQESFRPISNTREDSFVGRLKFYGRMLLDFQILTIYRHLKSKMPFLSGAVLDVGCGQSPYRHLLNPQRTAYSGIDIVDAEKFDYSNPDITPFDGQKIPFPDGSFDAVLCTEVLEHVFHHQNLVDEVYRVLKPGGEGIVTIPWSARYHYIPYDYFRYTPSSLRMIFEKFSEVAVLPRGSDISVIANKVVVLWVRNLIPSTPWRLVLFPFWAMFSVVVGAVVLLAHASLMMNFGSSNDPLGYTLIVKK